jgi:hypothetical protein
MTTPRASFAALHTPSIRDLASFAFQTSLATYLMFYLVDSLAPGFISRHFSVNILLAVTLFLGLDVMLFPPTKKTQKKSGRGNSLTDIVWVSGLSLVTMGLIWYQTKALGKISFVIALASGFLILLLSHFLLTGDEQEDNNTSDLN